MIINRITALILGYGFLLNSVGCGGGGQSSQALRQPSIFKMAGDNQVVLQHRAMPSPLQVRVTDSTGNGVSGASVTFSAAPGSGYIKPLVVLTDAGGLANWNGYLHTVGAQSILASSSGLPAVTFTETVSASGLPYDGMYVIYNSAGQPLFAENSNFFIQNSVILDTNPTFGPYSISFSDTTGQIDMKYHQTLTSFYYISGTLTLDGNGRITGAGTIMTGLTPNLTPAGTWTAERQ